MGLLRSEDIYLCKTAMTKDTSYDSLKALGRIENVSFIDMNTDKQVYELPFSHEVKRCDETLRRIEKIQGECDRLKVPLKFPETINSYYSAKEGLFDIMHVAEYKMFDSIEKEVKEYEEFLTHQTKSLSDINRDYQHLKEYYETVKASALLLARMPEKRGNWGGRNEKLERFSSDQEENSKKKFDLGRDEDSFQIRIGHIIGTINTNDLFNFKRFLFRTTRGNALVQSQDIKPKNSVKTKAIPKSSFVITFQEGQEMRRKLDRACISMAAKTFDYPAHNTQQVLDDLDHKIKETRKLLKDSNKELRNYLIKLNDLESRRTPGGNPPFQGISTIPMYKTFVQIEEEVYKNINCLRSVDNGNIIYGFVWSKTQAKEISDELTTKGHYLPELQFQDVIDHDFETPTHFKLNEFTSQFQVIVDTYGVPKYKEVNPTVFTIVSFPFLFGVMFGDVGHGGLLFMLAIFLCLFGKNIGALSTLYNVRYLLLLMGFFSTFCGFIYNDFMSIPIELWSSCYKERGDVAVKTADWIYPFGLDHKWYVASNELVFMNSLKMKVSVIFGVAQMLLGIFLKSLNAIKKNDFIEYLFEFWPQFILMWCWFGYMDILIIGKWLTDYKDSSIAPSIVASMIDMFLKFGAVEKEPILSDRETSEKLNVFLLITSVTCIPIMLLVRPIHSLITHNKPEEKDSRLTGAANVAHTSEIKGKNNGYYQFEDEEEINPNAKDRDAIDREIHREENTLHFNDFVQSHTGKGLREENKKTEEDKYVDDELENSMIKRRITALQLEDKEKHMEAMNQLKRTLKTEHETHGLEEIFVHQLIETIEFVLGTISNTASYLRLWALSLAHSQLAAVFYEKTVELGIETESPIVLFFVQQAFWAATIGVLMSMDSLEWFLHTLRLHWVEFQNKFYKGTGTKFAPLSFRRTIFKDEH